SPDVLTELALREPNQCAMDCLRPHRLSAQARAELLAASRERANPDQIQADLDRLDHLEGFEQADAPTAEHGVREPVARGQRVAAGVFERLDVVILGAYAVAQHRHERL